MGVQISRGVHSQVPQEDVVRGVATSSGRSVPKVGRAEGEQNRGGPSLSRSRAHVDLDPAKICGVAGDRIHQGKERDPLGSCIRREETKLRRPALLGERVLRIHGGAGHRSDTGLHQEARRGGYAPRADELVALTVTFRWPQTTGAASATPIAALSGSQTQSPRLCRGMLTKVAASKAQDLSPAVVNAPVRNARPLTH